MLKYIFDVIYFVHCNFTQAISLLSQLKTRRIYIEKNFDTSFAEYNLNNKDA